MQKPNFIHQISHRNQNLDSIYNSLLHYQDNNFQRPLYYKVFQLGHLHYSLIKTVNIFETILDFQPSVQGVR